MGGALGKLIGVLLLLATAGVVTVQGLFVERVGPPPAATSAD